MFSQNTYLLLDAAQAGMELIEDAQLHCRNSHGSLYTLDETNRHLAVVAPYIFEVDENLSRWYRQNVSGIAYGIMIVSAAGFEAIRNHCRKFLTVKTERGDRLYFRFYDPNVLKIFLPSCDNDQLFEFFGPINDFLIENNPGEITAFTLVNGNLEQKKKIVTELATG